MLNVLSCSMIRPAALLSRQQCNASLPRFGTLQGMRILELGCGCGLVGLCFAALGATVLLTDLPDPLVLSAHIPKLLS